MIRFEYLDKARSSEVLPKLFSILFSNMSVIAPAGASYGEELEAYLRELLPALEKEARKTVLIYDGGDIVGFFQYYVNETTFMMEEIQFFPRYQGKGLFQRLYAFLGTVVPDTVKSVEAYAHRKNTRSQAILLHLGLKVIEENERHFHYRGDCKKMLDKYRTT